MKKIVPFTKDLMFKTRIGEITSIALDNTLKLENNSVYGEFIISGTYKMLGGETEEEFKYNVPVDITIDTKYDTTNCLISIDDFSYEIINEEKLKVNISVMLDDLDIKEDPIETIEVEASEDRTTKEFTMLDQELNEVIKEIPIVKEENKTYQDESKTYQEATKTYEESKLFKTDDTKEYSIYRVYTMKQDDTLELIYEKFNVNKEILADYNDLDNLKVGSKLIIPSIDE